MEQTGFSDALLKIKDGKKVQREGWNGKGMWLVLISEWRPEGNYINAATLSFIAMKTVQDSLVPWLASQTDLLANDWQEVELPFTPFFP